MKLKARGPGRPTCAKTSYAPAFACVRGAPVAHEVLFLFNTHCIRLCPAAEKAVFASHVSSEPAAHIVLDALCKKPLITAELHLGEGTGAVASLPLWDMALAVYNGCYSFAEGGITPYTPQC